MSPRLACSPLPLRGLVQVQRQPLQDARGLFERLFCANELAAVGWTQAIAQINHSVTRQRGSVRGLHYQRAPHAEMKLVSCLRGEVWDVAVDLRADSPTFLQWHAERLSADNACALLIPPGFAHGFQALTEDAELLYLHSAAYAPGAEAGLNPLDPRLALPWPLPVGAMSERDRSHALLTASFEGVHL
ncbi:MAG: dTDP-4-dehydrorhamnose 3,5-epimerase family protein [Giesbergeria sp.]